MLGESLLALSTNIFHQPFNVLLVNLTVHHKSSDDVAHRYEVRELNSIVLSLDSTLLLHFGMDIGTVFTVLSGHIGQDIILVLVSTDISALLIICVLSDSVITIDLICLHHVWRVTFVIVH